MFGRSIRETRRSVGLSIEKAAHLSGMQVSEWLAIETGYAPEDVNRLRAVADTMEVSFDQIAMAALLCREAGEF
jgi:transcriptional regulator with XRE-family HTH domain